MKNEMSPKGNGIDFADDEVELNKHILGSGVQ